MFSPVLRSCFAALLFVLAAHSAYGAEFDEGLRAYDQGDYAKAFQIWKPLAEANDLAAMRNLGHLYRFGRGVDKNPAEAARWYRRAADRGFDRAQANLGAMYLTGEGLQQDYREAAVWFERAARQGHAVAQYNLGVLFETGAGVDRNIATAMGWYSLAARSNHPMALARLGELVNGLPTLDGQPGQASRNGPRDVLALAQTGSQTAVPTANPAPAATSSVTRPDGLETAPQTPKAASPAAAAPPAPKPEPTPVDSLAATQTQARPQPGNSQAENSQPERPGFFARLFGAGDPSPPQQPLATANNQPIDVSPPVREGNILQGDEAVRRGDFREAYAQWLPVAQRGDAEAQVRIAKLYNGGQGVAVNARTAYMWLHLAAARGNGEAMAMIAALSRALTPQDIAEARQQAPTLLTGR